MERSESIVNISKALVKAMNEMEKAKKDSKNPYYKSNYADINSLHEASKPALAANGLTVIQPPASKDGINYIETVILHESGEFISSLNEVIVAKQNDPQNFLAAQTYTRRGAYQAILNMASFDDDGNTASGKVKQEVPEEAKPQEGSVPASNRGKFSRRS